MAYYVRDLTNYSVKRHLPIFSQNYHSDCKFKVQLSATLSEEYKQEAAVPQGTLSTTLFIHKTN